MNELYHNGILGQKWGIRRFQNKDGTRTAVGKEHRKDSKDKINKKKNRNVSSVAASLSAIMTAQRASQSASMESQRASQSASMEAQRAAQSAAQSANMNIQSLTQSAAQMASQISAQMASQMSTQAMTTSIMAGSMMMPYISMGMW